jgi:hypothetical protein
LAQGRLGVVNLLHDKLGEPLANQKRKKKGRRVLSFTVGGDGTAAADEQRRRRCVLGELQARVLAVKEQRGKRKLELDLK